MAISKFVFSFAILVCVSSAHAGPQLSRGAQEIMQEEQDQYLEQRAQRGRLQLRAQFQQTGAFEVVGTPSPAQAFSRGKLVPCSINRDPVTNVVFAARGSCDESRRIYVPLTDGAVQPATQVQPGLYLFGYENSIYPGYVIVRPGQTTRVTLTQIPVPTGGTVKVFRDLTTLDEQRKIYFTTYTTGKSFFKLGEWSFGDLYVQRVGNLNTAPSLDYKFCEQSPLPDMTAKGDRICRAWAQPNFMGTMEMFDFRNDSRFFQWEVRRPGKPYAYKFARHLVAKATTSARASFVNVLPGSYSIEILDTNKGTTKIIPASKLGPLDAAGQLVTSFGMLPDPSVLALSGAVTSSDEEDPQLPPGENCASASMWRTDLRAHCKADTQEGCDRTTARLCEPMIPDLQ